MPAGWFGHAEMQPRVPAETGAAQVSRWRCLLETKLMKSLKSKKVVLTGLNYWHQAIWEAPLNPTCFSHFPVRCESIKSHMDGSDLLQPPQRSEFGCHNLGLTPSEMPIPTVTAVWSSWKISSGMIPDFPVDCSQGLEVHEGNHPPLTGSIMSELITATGDGKLAPGFGQTAPDCWREGDIWIFLPIKKLKECQNKRVKTCCEQPTIPSATEWKWEDTKSWDLMAWVPPDGHWDTMKKKIKKGKKTFKKPTVYRKILLLL